MTSRAEQILCESLRAILSDLPNGASIERSKRFWDALGALEFCLPEFLGPEWHDGFDGFTPVFVRKTCERQAELVGLCILISDQALAPIHLHIQIASNTDRISWLECTIGENGEHGMVRTPYASLDAALKRMYEYCFLAGSAHTIDWVYKVTFGEKRVC